MTKQVVSKKYITSTINPCPAELGYILFENNLDPDQLASDEANLLRIHTVFHFASLYLECCKYFMRGVVYEIFSMARVKDKCIYKG